MIVAWSPYGKGQGTSPSVMGIFGLVGLDNGIFSGLEKFEGPDPAYWCAHGYADLQPRRPRRSRLRGRQRHMGPPGGPRLP